MNNIDKLILTILIDSYLKKNNNKNLNRVQTIRDEINSMDDEVFSETAQLLKIDHPEEFKIMQTLEDENSDIDLLETSYEVYKDVVRDYLSNKIADCKSSIDEYLEQINELEKQMNIYEEELNKIK